MNKLVAFLLAVAVTLPVGIIAVESSFQEDSSHKRGPSVGLMQINIAAHGKEATKSPRANVAFGTKLLKSYRENATSDSRALTAYNAGPGKVSSICKQYKTCNSEYFLKVQKAKKQILAYNGNGGKN